MRFLTDEDSPLPRPRTSSWSSGNQVPTNYLHGPPPLEVWAPSLTLGRDGPGIILKEGKVSVQRKGLETAPSDLNSNPQKSILSQPALSAVSAQFCPSRYVGFLFSSSKIFKDKRDLRDLLICRILLLCFQTQSYLNTFSPDGLRDQSTSRRACSCSQTTTWWPSSGHTWEQWADRLIQLQCTSSSGEAQLTT